MKFASQLVLLLGAFALESASSAELFVPTRISFEDLAKNGGSDAQQKNDVFWKTLREVGLLSITDIPGFNKQLMLKDLEECLHHPTNDLGAPDVNLDHLASVASGNATPHHSRRRRTLATRTIAREPEGILTATKVTNDADVCGELKASSKTFRKAVQRASEAIAARFGEAMSSALRGENKISVESLINNGEHLEHFHSYYSDHEEASTEGIATASNSADNDASASIDWHTDQGMMLIFTPGQFQDGTQPNGFFIKLRDGTTVEVDFDSQVDDLVIMLGDGVNQYINDNNYGQEPLRAVPHAVALPNNHKDTPRLWYGRMVLPPPEAIHPSANGSTFGDIRTAMIEGDSSALSLGCASSSMIARELMESTLKEDEEEKKCDPDTEMLCWMRCMNFEEYELNITSCESQSENHNLVCATEGGLLWEAGIHSSDYSLRCLTVDEIGVPEVITDGGDEMDHSGMDHSGMDHSGMDHSGMDHSGMDHDMEKDTDHDHSDMDHDMEKNMDHDHSDMDHDHSDEESAAPAKHWFTILPGLMGLMIANMN